MIIFMSDILCITNRSLCGEDFLVRLERIASGRCAGIILREKDLSAKEYEVLAEKVLPIVRARQVPCILHSYPQAAARERGDPAAGYFSSGAFRAAEEKFSGAWRFLPYGGGGAGSRAAGLHLHYCRAYFLYGL